MRRLILVLLPIIPTAAPACLNDKSIRRVEDQFRSRYDEPAPAVPTRAGNNPWAVAALVVGGMLTATAFTAYARRPKPAKP